MEISDLTAPFMQNHDRIVTGNDRKDDQAWKYAVFSTKAGKFLIKRQGILTRHKSCYAGGDYEWIDLIERTADSGYSVEVNFNNAPCAAKLILISRLSKISARRDK